MDAGAILATGKPKRTVTDLKQSIQTIRVEHEAVLIIPIEKIRTWPDQPRKHFSKKSIEKLARSIDAAGQKTPVHVSIDPDKPDEYLLVDGERRLRARRLSGGRTLRAIVVSWEEAEERFASSTIINFNNEPHTRYETAMAVNRLYKRGKDADEIAAMFGRSNCWVWQHLSLTKLDQRVVDLMDEDRPFESRLKFCIAILLVNLPSELQFAIAKEITDKNIRSTAARHFVQVKAAEAGHTVGGIAGRPEKRRGSLGSLVTIVEESLLTFLSAPDISLCDFLAGFPEADLERITLSSKKSLVGWQTLCDTANEVLAEMQADRAKRAVASGPKKKRKKGP